MGKTLVECWKNDMWLKIFSIASIVLILTSFFLPPTGTIDPTAMAGTGEFFAFATLWQLNKAIDKNLSAKIKVKEIELSIEQEKRKRALEENTTQVIEDE